MKASDSLKIKIKAEEGFASKAYKDGMINGVQQYSIGYGHQIKSNEQSLKTTTITKAQADAIFDKDIAVYEGSVNKNLKRAVSQSQFDALVDFAYNAGTGAAAKVISTWNTTGDSVQTTEHMKLYNKSRDTSGNLVVNATLVARRLRESVMFLSGEVKKKV